VKVALNSTIIARPPANDVSAVVHCAVPYRTSYLKHVQVLDTSAAVPVAPCGGPAPSHWFGGWRRAPVPDLGGSGRLLPACEARARGPSGPSSCTMGEVVAPGPHASAGPSTGRSAYRGNGCFQVALPPPTLSNLRCCEFNREHRAVSSSVTPAPTPMEPGAHTPASRLTIPSQATLP